MSSIADVIVTFWRMLLLARENRRIRAQERAIIQAERYVNLSRINPYRENV